MGIADDLLLAGSSAEQRVELENERHGSLTLAPILRHLLDTKVAIPAS